MNPFKAFKRIMKRILREELYSDPKRAVKLYRKKGIQIGENTELYNVLIDSLRPFLVEIGSNTLITGTRILTHDASTKKTLGVTKLGRVRIGDNVFIGTGCIILPNVTIGNNVIVGAGTVVSADVPENSVVVGNPMKIVSTYEKNVEKNNERMKTAPTFDLNYNMTAEEKAEMKKKLENSEGYIIVPEGK